MAFHTTNRTFTLTTSATSAYMQLPVPTMAFIGTNAIQRYLVTNPGTTIQYFAGASDALQTVVAPVGVSNTTATETMGTPILPGQQVLVNHGTNSITPYFYGLSPGGASTLNVTYGSGD